VAGLRLENRGKSEMKGLLGESRTGPGGRIHFGRPVLGGVTGKNVLSTDTAAVAVVLRLLVRRREGGGDTGA